MIEQVSGNILQKSPTFCVLDCHGIGVGLHISLNTFQFLEHSETTLVQLHAYLHVREDALQLFGFADPAEKQLFQLLISITGVGPKLAVSILSGYTPETLRDAITREDVGMLTRIPGVGKKTAQRLILELKEKINKQSQARQFAALIQDGAPSVSQHINEAILALTELGYKSKDAQEAVEQVIKSADGAISLEEIVVSALKKL